MRNCGDTEFLNLQEKLQLEYPGNYFLIIKLLIQKLQYTCIFLYLYTLALTKQFLPTTSKLEIFCPDLSLDIKPGRDSSVGKAFDWWSRGGQFTPASCPVWAQHTKVVKKMTLGECGEGTAYATLCGIVSRHVLSPQGNDSHQGWVSSLAGGGGNIVKHCRKSVKILAALNKSNPVHWKCAHKKEAQYSNYK